MTKDSYDRRLDEASLSPVKRALLERMARGMRVPAPARRASTASPSTPSVRQRQMWLAEQVQPGSSVHNQAFVIGIAGEVDIPSLEAALHEVVLRHDTLRTAFVERDHAPLAVPQEVGKPALPVTSVATEADVARAVAADVERPIDLTRTG